MKKLILVALLLIVVLLISWWARGANFSIFTMMQDFTHPTSATPSATIHPSVNSGQAPTPIPVEILITITPNGFVPDVIMISPNTKITWVNKTPFTATIASDPQNAYAPLNLGDVGQNASVSLIFPNDGRFNYENAKNPTQKGTLVVK